MSVIGAGRHLVQVVSHQLGRSGTGTPHIAVLFEDAIGDRITYYGYLSDAAIEHTLKALAALGWDPVQHDGRLDSLNGTTVLVGNEAEIVVENDVYEGQSRPKVKWVNEPGGGGLGEGMPTDDAAAFAAQLRTRVLSAPRPQANAKPGQAKSEAPAPAAPFDEDDDLPF